MERLSAGHAAKNLDLGRKTAFSGLKTLLKIQWKVSQVMPGLTAPS